MLRSVVCKRFASGAVYHGTNQVSLPRRPLKKIRLGKARPAIYHQFEVQIELSDGSVITRKSQFPKSEIRMIQDQRNNPLWNESRDDLVIIDTSAGGKMDKFRQKYGSMYNIEDMSKKRTDKEKVVDEKQQDDFSMNDYLTLLNQNAQPVQSGGKLATKKKDKNK